MNHATAPIADGYYWAKYNHEHPQVDDRWLIAQVYDTGNGQRGLSKKVALTGVDLAFDLPSFTFGPRIEEPAEVNTPSDAAPVGRQ